MIVKIIDPSKDKKWDDFIFNHPWGSVYQLSSYMEVISQTFKHTTPCYIICEEEGMIKAGVPFFLIKSWLTGTKLISLPFSPFSDPLVDNKEQFRLIFEKAKEVLTENRGTIIELRILKNDVEINNNEIIRKKDIYKYHILKISDSPENILKSFHKTCVQNRIKKAWKNDVTVYSGHSDEDLKAFYIVLVKNRKLLGLPPQPFGFFHNFMKRLSKDGLFHLLLAKWNNEVVAGFILLKAKKSIIIDYIAQDHSYKRFSPGHLLFWETILIAYREGYQYVDFGKTNSKHEGLIEFKRRWGCKEYELQYFFYPNVEKNTKAREESIQYRFANLFFKAAPLWAGKIASRFVYKHIA